MPLSDKKITVFAGQNDLPELPSSAKAGNASDLIQRYNALIDELTTRLADYDAALAYANNVNNTQAANITDLLARITSLESKVGGSGPVITAAFNETAYTKGNRSALITVTATTNMLLAAAATEWPKLVDGSRTSTTNAFRLTTTTTLNGSQGVTFQLAKSQRFSAVKIHLGTVTTAFGYWRWIASNNNSDWEGVSAEYLLFRQTGTGTTELSQSGGTLVILHAQKPYKYYRMIGLTGSLNTTTTIEEIEFYGAPEDSIIIPGDIGVFSTAGIGPLIFSSATNGFQGARYISVDNVDFKKVTKIWMPYIGKYDFDYTADVKATDATYLLQLNDSNPAIYATYEILSFVDAINHREYTVKYRFGNLVTVNPSPYLKRELK